MSLCRNGVSKIARRIASNRIRSVAMPSKPRKKKPSGASAADLTPADVRAFFRAFVDGTHACSDDEPAADARPAPAPSQPKNVGNNSNQEHGRIEQPSRFFCALAQTELNMHQPTLFSPTPPNAYGAPIVPVRAHNADPITSHDAAERAERSGKVARHRAVALALVKAWPARTGYELWELASGSDKAELVNHHELYRRLADLKNAALVVQGEPRHCTIKGSRMVTWSAAA
jgi:hypothetical protein